MTSKKELRIYTDKLPSGTPNNISSDLHNLHSAYHQAGEVDESVPHTFTSVEDLDDRQRLEESLRNIRPTNLQEALEIEEKLTNQATRNLGSDWAGSTLKSLLTMRRDHNPPSKINHDID